MSKIKIILIVLALTVLLLVGCYFLFIKDSSGTDNVAEQKGATGVADSAKKKSSASNSDSTEPASYSIVINDISQSGGNVSVSSTVNTASPGECTFNFSSANTKSVLRTGDSISQSSEQLCKIDVPEVEFTKLGDWNLVVSFISNGKRAEASQNVTIN